FWPARKRGASLLWTQLRKHIGGIERRRARLSFCDRRGDLFVQSRPLFVVELVPSVGDLERDDAALGQVRRLVEDEATVANAGSKGFHERQSSRSVRTRHRTGYTSDVNGHALDLLRSALALPLDERVELVAELLASMDEADTHVEAAWGA